MTAPLGRIVVASQVDTDPLRPHLDDPQAALPPGRGAPAVTRLVDGLLAAGHDVTVVTCDEQVPAGTEQVAEGPHLRLRYGHYRPGGRARDLFRVERDWIKSAIADEVAGLEAAVVHAHWTYEYALAALAVRPDAVVTVRDWGPLVLRYHRHPYRVVRLAMQVQALRRARHLTTNSPYLDRVVRRWVRRADVTMIPNAVPDTTFRDLPRRPLADPPTLVAVNNGWGERKNVHRLLEAMPSILASRPGTQLRLVGTDYGPDGPAAAAATELGVASAVTFVGQVGPAQVLDELALADVFVHPAREETFGNVLVEAMAQGLPVIGGRDAGAVPWVLDDGGAGVLVDVRRPEAIADAVVDLVGDATRWRELGERGHARAREHFALDHVVDAYVELFSRVVASGAPSS